MYYAKVNWYNVVHEEDVVENMIICEDDWNKAVREITNTFENVNSINIIEINFVNNKIVSIPESSVSEIIDLNTTY